MRATQFIIGLQSFVACCILPLALPAHAQSAHDSAQSTVTITRSEDIRISDLTDWDFGTRSVSDVSDEAVSIGNSTCVQSSTGSYSLAISSRNSGKRFQVESVAGDRIRYHIQVRYQQGNEMRVQQVRRSQATLSNLSGSLVEKCAASNGWNLRFTPVIDAQQFSQAAPGMYQDVVTLFVTPE